MFATLMSLALLLVGAFLAVSTLAGVGSSTPSLVYLSFTSALLAVLTGVITPALFALSFWVGLLVNLAVMGFALYRSLEVLPFFLGRVS